jgi:LPXTG-motif cell wall-anchored protein
MGRITSKNTLGTWLLVIGTFPISLPTSGQAQANDLLAWGALAACIAIAAGLVLISRRRRKDRDGL